MTNAEVAPPLGNAKDRPSSSRQLAKRLLTSACPKSWLLDRAPPACRGVCLTFDDGPHPEHTPPLLDALANACVHATFFLIGREAERHPQLVRRIIDEGHEVGSHTWSHAPPEEVDVRRFGEEIVQTRQVLRELIGVDVRLVRPPHGRLTAGKLVAAWRARQTIALWTTDLRDFACQDDGELTDRIDAWSPLAGDVVLLHDNRPFAARCVSRIAEKVRSQALKFLTVSEALDHA